MALQFTDSDEFAKSALPQGGDRSLVPSQFWGERVKE
jgi:hypothetical protein